MSEHKDDLARLKNLGIFHTDTEELEDDYNLVPDSLLEDVASDTATRLQRNEEVIRMFRDLERAILILKSSILNPKDITRRGVGYSLKGLYLPTQVAEAFTNVLKTEMEETYDFISTLGDIVLESYIMSGAYCTVFMNYDETKNTIYKNNDVVEQKKPIRTLDNHLEHAYERIPYMTNGMKDVYNTIHRNLANYISYTEDASIIHDVDAFVEDFREDDSLTEEQKKFNEEIEDVFSILTYKYNERERVKMYETPLKKRGTIFKVNVDAVIPIPLKSNPKKHLEYYILLDKDGMPVDKVRELEEINARDGRKQLMNRYIDVMGDDETKETYSISDKLPPNVDIDDKIFDNIIGNLVVTDRLKHKTLDSTLNDIHTIMLYRALKKQETKVLILPARAVSYIAINYRSNGTGESLMERIQVLASMRGMVAISDVMGYIDNNIPKTKIKAKIPATNKNPMKVAASIIANVVKNRQVRMPVNMLKMTDFVNWGHTVGVAYEFDHPRMVNLQMSSEEGTKTNFGSNDVDMEKNLKNKMLLTLGVPPEFVENSISPNFAVEILTQNALYNLTINGIQEDLNRYLSDYVRKHAIYDGVIFDKLMDVVNENRRELNDTLSIELDENTSEKLVNYILNFFVIKLPAVEVTADEGLDKRFKDYTDSIETYINKVYGEMSDDRIEDIELVKTAIKHKLYSKWLLDNDYMTELIQVFNIVDNENKKNVLTEYRYVIDNIVEGFKDYKDTLEKNKGAEDVGDEDPDVGEGGDEEPDDGTVNEPDEYGSDDGTVEEPDENEPEPDETGGDADKTKEPTDETGDVPDDMGEYKL